MLAGISNERRGLVLMMLWRCWHLRNDAVHEKGECSIKGSQLLPAGTQSELQVE
jgi:hypothetical protein